MHTIELKTNLIKENSELHQDLSNLMKNSPSNESFTCYDRPAPITITERPKAVSLFKGQISFMGSVFYLRVDCLELLQKSNVETDEDIIFIKSKVNQFLQNTGLCVDDLTRR